MQQITYVEELTIMLIDENTGRLLNVPDRTLGYVLSGAVLLDLARLNRIDTDPDSLMLLDGTPVGDDLLDPLLADIAQAGEAKSIEHWVRHGAGEHIDHLIEQALERLVARGILDTDDGRGYFRLSRQVIRRRMHYPPLPADGAAEEGGAGTAQEDDARQEEIRTRVMRIVLDDELPGPDELPIISLADACGLFQRILPSEDYDRRVRERIETLAAIGLVERTVAGVVRRVSASEALEMGEAVRRHGGTWPKVPGLPFFGNAFSMNRDLPGFFLKHFRELGSVYEMSALGRKWVVLAGPEANRFMTRQAANHLRTGDLWTGFNEDMGAHQSMVSLDGAPHSKLRRALQYGYSAQYARTRVPDIVEGTKRHLDRLPTDTPVTVNEINKSLVTDLLGILTVGMSSDSYVKDINGYITTLLLVHVLKKLPPVVRFLPGTRRRTRRMEEMFRKIVAGREPGKRQGCPRDLGDDIFELHANDPLFLPETDLFTNLMGPYLAGIDTAANTLSLLLYSLLKDPDTMVRLQKEADDFFAGGGAERRELQETGGHTQRPAGNGSVVRPDSGAAPVCRQRLRIRRSLHSLRHDGDVGDVRIPPAGRALPQSDAFRHRPLFPGQGLRVGRVRALRPGPPQLPGSGFCPAPHGRRRRHHAAPYGLRTRFARSR